MKNSIQKTIELNAPVAKVWRALTDYREFGEWFRVKIEAPFTPGEIARGKILYPGFEHVTWEVTIRSMETDKLFSFTWHPYAVEPDQDYSKEEPTLVEFRLEATPSGTRLTVTESGFDRIPAFRRDEAFRMNEGGWSIQVVNISIHLSERKKSATSFLEMAATGKVREAYERFLSPSFTHHNQYFKGDRASLMEAMEEAARKNPRKSIQVMKVIEEGDTVVTLSHVQQNPEDAGAAVTHIFRFEGAQVAELWDLGQPIAKDSINENGVF